MLFGGLETGNLEVRRAADGSHTLRGRFPYGHLPSCRTVGGPADRARKSLRLARSHTG